MGVLERGSAGTGSALRFLDAFFSGKSATPSTTGWRKSNWGVDAIASLLQMSAGEKGSDCSNGRETMFVSGIQVAGHHGFGLGVTCAARSLVNDILQEELQCLGCM